MIAAVVLMAHIGSFVPAASAEIPLTDRIFTRIGAADNLATGESTFMLEMNECSNIVHNATRNSLILLDEVGRGTSTYDGISIARAMVEYIHDHPTAKAKTLFATHYHELNELEAAYPRVKNYNIAIKEVGNKVVFLRKLVRGGSEHSFGIHVAQMAGMPKSVTERATAILGQLESIRKSGGGKASAPAAPAKREEAMQLSFFQLDDPVLSQIRDQIKSMDVNNLTPIEALNKLSEIKRIAGL
jgi:DNA mismatch repair protein MutS